LEGAFLAAVAQCLGERLAGRRCRGVVELFDDTPVLEMGGELLVLSARPGDPTVSLEPGGLPSGLPRAAVWDDHLDGALLEGVGTLGLDRVLVLEFRSAAAYSTARIGVVFEAAGRNANAILVRLTDSRILACTRLVTSRNSRYRRIAPGAEYRRPPPTGAPPEEWGGREVADALARAADRPSVYKLLEGVGPVTASAFLAEAALSGKQLPLVVAEAGRAIVERRFEPWMTPLGPVPLKLGPGEPIPDPLGLSARPALQDGGDRRSAILEGFLARTGAESAALERKIARLRNALEESVPSSVYRRWGDLLLARSADAPPRVDEAVLRGWDGEEVLVPVRPSRSWRDNAERYFRKARNAELEKRNLQELLEVSTARLSVLSEALEEARRNGTVDPALLPPAPARLRERSGPVERQLAPGWRCWIGRNASENDRVTFRIGRRGDIWLHARGSSGAHVVLRGEGRQAGPPAAVLEQAAALAALRSRSTSDVVPVDYTLVQHVRKPRGAAPGEVLYVGEKTLFVRIGARRGRRPAVKDGREGR